MVEEGGNLSNVGQAKMPKALTGLALGLEAKKMPPQPQSLKINQNNPRNLKMTEIPSNLKNGQNNPEA